MNCQPGSNAQPHERTFGSDLDDDAMRLMQAELKRSNDRYADLYDHAPVGYVTLERGGHITEANPLAASLLGTPLEHLSGRTLMSYVHRAHVGDLHHYLSALAAGEDPGTLEIRIVPADGRTADVACWVALEAGRASRGRQKSSEARIALIDITDRVRMQERVSRLAAIVASSGDAIIGRDCDGRVDSWNDGARRLFGHDAAQMLGRRLDELVPPELRAQEADLLHRLGRGERVAHLETERLSRQGQRVPVSMSLSPIHDDYGHVVGSAMIARDVTERRRSDRALRERVRQLDVLSQSGQALILGEQDPATMRQELLERVRLAVGCEICLDYRVGNDGQSIVLLSHIGLNEAQQTLLGEVPMDESPCGVAVRRKSRVVVDHVQDSPMPQARRLQQAGARCYVGYPLVAHGHVFGVAAFISTSRDRFRRGDLLVVKALCDQVSAMLERSELMARLRHSEQTMREAARAKDEMIATLAHELRNPLAPIRNAVGILRRDVLNDPARVVWCRDIIERQVSQMSRLLEDLLDVSRLTRHKVELRLEKIDLKRALDQAMEATQPMLEARGQAVRIEMPGYPLCVEADLTRLTQVFVNLLNNASKYSEPGSAIELRSWREDDTVCASVRDSGIGISPDQLPLVFDMFSQLAPAIERSGGGLGIGLALARGLVEQHRGQLDASSAGPGQGSVFTVRLPACEPVLPRPSQLQAELIAPPRRRWLVVDDNIDAAQTLATMLSLHGQEVRAAHSGFEALQMASEWRPDVAVLDIGMPGLNGYELCARLRQLFGARPPLCIACTGWGQASDRDAALVAGFDHHWVKPIEYEALLGLLDKV
ncbi:PAS domain S-box protein [Ideonella sp. DXS29W]|uniref:histidine kinase n=1 Tax=Ideonella lacteola TaxID=2984193 RepID=A0ABU9BLD8_9BURK